MRNIKSIVENLKSKFNTNDPKLLAELLDINIVYIDLNDTWGMYRYIKRNKFIFINNNLDEIKKRFVLAHELGHAILHTKNNCFYLKHNTYTKVSSFEIEANKFAIELILSDNDLLEIKDMNFNLEQMACYFRVPLELLEFKFNHKI